MTTVIVVMNRSAIAMAADSLVSIRESSYGQPGQHAKSYDGARKMIQVGSHVGAMFYDSPDFHGVPWEVILGQFAETHGTNKYDTVGALCEAFFTFLDADSLQWVDALGYSELVEDILEPAVTQLDSDWKRARLAVEDKSDEGFELGAARFVEDWVGKRLEAISSLPQVTLSAAKLAASESTIAKVFEDSVSELWTLLSNAGRLQLINHGRLELERIRKSERDRTGLVFAGFGQKQLFPAAHSYVVSGRLEGGVRYSAARQTLLSPQEPAVVLPAAQRDLIQSFMEGMNPLMVELVDAVLEELVARIDLPAEGQRSLLQIAQDQLQGLRDRNSKTVLDGVSYLSAHDLASLAHALVASTALRNRVSLQPDTVGGPFDVAVISRADGFQWVQRASGRRGSKRSRAVDWGV